jgi:Ca2+-binding RTX toxin-like protein
LIFERQGNNMTISNIEAVNLLRSNPAAYDTLDKLRALAAQVSTDAAAGFTQGKTTVLYSGNLSNGSTKTTEIITSMVSSNADVRVLDKTQAFKFLTSSDFLGAVGRVQGVPLRDMLDDTFRHPVKDWLFDGKSGPWAETSKRFVDATTGPVKILTESPRAASVFLQTELPALFQKLQTSTDITEISGINRQKWLAEFANDTDRLNAVVRSAASETLLTKPTPTNFSSFISLTESSYLSLQRSAQSDYFAAMQKVARDYPMTAVATRSFARLGTPLAVLGAVLVGFQAGEAHAAGRPDEARTIVEDYAAEMAASTAGQAAGFTVATLGIAALTATGFVISAPVAVGVVLIASVVGGYFGGEYGKEIAFLFQDRSEAQKRDVAQRMLKLMYGEDYNLNTAVPPSILQRVHNIDATFSREEMVSAAKQNIAWRYALRELNPFVIQGDELYAQHNTDKTLDLYDPDTDKGEMSEKYLQDRAAMLTWKLRYDKEKLPYSSEYNTTEIEGNWDFVDKASGITLAIDGVGISLFDKQVVFGTKAGETLEGSGDSDSLYGMAGNDTLEGKAGDDYIEGNSGQDNLNGGDGKDILLGGADDDTINGGNNDKANDTLLGGQGTDNYLFNASYGRDIIQDSDGKGTINVNGQVLTGGAQYGDNRVYRSADKKHTYVLANDNTLLINGQIIVNSYNRARGDLGLTYTLAAPQSNPTTTRDIKGDLQPLDVDPVREGVQLAYDELGNLIVTNTIEAGRGDGLYDSTANDRITSGGGDDSIYTTRGGDNWVEAGSGRDWVRGGAGMDLIEGGNDADILQGGAGDDRLFAGSQTTVAQAIADGNSQSGTDQLGDFLSGNTGDDVLAGSSANDALLGGGGNDLLIGGAGNDWMAGDVGWIPTSMDWSAYSSGFRQIQFTAVEGIEKPLDYGNDVMYCGEGNDSGLGGRGNDVVFGEAGDDYLTGGGDNDVLFGGAGRDVIFGDGTYQSIKFQAKSSSSPIGACANCY